MGVLAGWHWNLALFSRGLLVKDLATGNFFIPPFVGDKGRLNAVRKDGYIISGRRFSSSWILLSLRCSRGQLAFQFYKAQVSVLSDKELRNQGFLGGMDRGIAPVCEVGQITLLKTSVQMQGNPLRITQRKHRPSLIHSVTAEKSFPEAFMEYVPPQECESTSRP